MKKPFFSIAEEISQAMSIKYNTMVYDLQRQKRDVIVLSLGEAFFDIPLFSFSELPAERGYHYSHSRGIIELRQKISKYYKHQYGVSSDPETELLVSSGSKVVIYMAFLAVLNPGDEVIIFEPAWVSYTEQVRLCHGVPIMLPYYKGVKDVEKYITKKTKVIVINNPNNPSGKVYSKEELQELYDISIKHKLYIISDEAYSDFVLREPFISMGCFDNKKKRLIVVNSISKNLGMSGWRIGYVITNAELIDIILKINQHLITCPTTLIEFYLAHYFDKIFEITKPQIEKVVRDREGISHYMEEIGLLRLPGSGTFYFCVSIQGSKLNSEKFATKLLKERYVATVPGIGYGNSVDKFLRVSVGAESIERIKRGLLAIRNLIRETST